MASFASDNFVGQKMLSLVTYLAGVDLDMLNSVQIKKKDLDCALLKRLSNCHCWNLYRHSKILY